MSEAEQDRPEQLRREYEDEVRATHYREDRWTRSARARRTNAKELAIVTGFLEEAIAAENSDPEGKGPEGACVRRLNRILDLPCGTGRFRTLLQEGSRELWSMDASHEMLASAPPQAGIQGSVHAIPLQDDCVDAILCSRLLHHFEHAEQRLGILKQLARVSRRWVFLSYFDAASFQAWRNRVRGRFRGRFPVARATFTAEVHAAGLVERERRYIRRGVSEQVWVMLERGG